ncbi:MAG: hypothetical protein D6759_17015 [Chloroflexi bacterium]|nr:MAG: hypothetical protein D6759_17015 [Chloroflexota bacterium]
MMLNLREYHRPADLEEAVRLLRRREPRTVPLAGGTVLVPSQRRDVEAVVDLADLGLAYVRLEEEQLRIGATTTLQQLAETPLLGDPPAGRAFLRLLAETAHATAPSTLRTAATVGGVLAAPQASTPLIVALLALDARLTLWAPRPRQTSLESFLAYRERLLADGALITEVNLPLPAPDDPPARTAWAWVGRTPHDRPIVCAAVWLVRASDTVQAVRLALGGVADHPIRLPALERELQGAPLDVAALTLDIPDPPADFLGSAEYRRAMALQLARRALARAWEG